MSNIFTYLLSLPFLWLIVSIFVTTVIVDPKLIKSKGKKVLFYILAAPAVATEVIKKVLLAVSPVKLMQKTYLWFLS